MAGSNDHRSRLLGSGWAFPIRVDGTGGVSVSSGESDIEQSIRIIIGTAKGERRMRPTFGCAIHELVFAPSNAATASLAEHYVAEALGQWEPRIEVVDVVAEPEEQNVLRVAIIYKIRQTNERRNLVYPFYRIPEEADL